MNINPICITDNVYKKNTVQNGGSEINQKSIAVSRSVQTNSMNEVLGRTQVSFCGQNKVTEDFFEHDCSEFINGIKEHILYNKHNGSFSHTITDKKGNFIKQESIFPLEGKEVITRAKSYGRESIETNQDGSKKLTRLDWKGREIFFRTTSADGNKTTVITDYKLNRKKIIAENNQDERTVQIIDMTSNTPVTSGRLIYDEVYDEVSDMYLTKNLLTGITEKAVKLNSKKEIVLESIYSPQDGRLQQQTLYNPKRIKTYENDVIRSYIKFSDDGRIKKEYEYDKDGKTEIRHADYLLSSKNPDKVLRETIFIPETNLKSESTKYTAEGREVTKYRENSNTIAVIDVYDNDDNLTEVLKYYQDGKVVSKRVSFDKDGSFETEFFTKYGIKYKGVFYSKNKTLSAQTKYDTETGILKMAAKILDNGDYEAVLFDDEGLKKTRIAVYSKDNKIKEVTLLQDDGVTPDEKRLYHKDGSYTFISYDEYGREKNRKEYNSDDSLKPEGSAPDNDDDDSSSASNAYNSQSAASNNDSSASSTDTYDDGSSGGEGEKDDYASSISENISVTPLGDIPEDEFLEKISDIISMQYYAVVADEDWDRLSEILEIDDKHDLFPIDKQTFRSLSKKYHTDINQSGEQKQKNDIIFGIINNLYNYNS